MAGVFLVSLGTIWLHTGLMPRRLSFFTYAIALVRILTAA